MTHPMSEPHPAVSGLRKLLGLKPDARAVAVCHPESLFAMTLLLGDDAHLELQASEHVRRGCLVLTRAEQEAP